MSRTVARYLAAELCEDEPRGTYVARKSQLSGSWYVFCKPSDHYVEFDAKRIQELEKKLLLSVLDVEPQGNPLSLVSATGSLLRQGIPSTRSQLRRMK